MLYLYTVMQQGTTMAKTRKNTGKRSTSTIDLGIDRKKRINAFRANSDLKGTPLPTMDEAVNMLVDKALELEQIPMTAE